MIIKFQTTKADEKKMRIFHDILDLLFLTPNFLAEAKIAQKSMRNDLKKT